MRKSSDRLSVLVAAGSLWGLGEAGLGMHLRGTCAYEMTGSVMTGLAIFFLSVGLASSRKVTGLLVMFGLAAAFKLLDAYLLHLPVLHGAIINPIFAFATEVLAFAFLFHVLDAQLKEKRFGQALLGGLSALVAVNLFPFVGHFTGISACVAAGTTYPLSLYYAPLAVGLSMVTCPLGTELGRRLAWLLEEGPAKKVVFARVAMPAIAALSLAIVVLLRST